MSRRDRVLVDSDWVTRHLHDADVVVLEADERPLIYQQGHVPGAHCLDWQTDLQDPLTRDIPDQTAIHNLWRRVGVTPASTIIFYGDKNNWYACFAFWLFRIYGAKDLRLLDGGRQAWINEERPLDHQPTAPSTTPGQDIAVPKRDDTYRADWQATLQATTDGTELIDVRTLGEFRGDLLTPPGYPREGAQRAGHIPTARHVPWEIAVNTDGKLLPDDQLADVLTGRGVDLSTPAITYCRIGERSAHTWFVMHELLGMPDVRNYDGSWAEWGSMIGMPVAIGDK